MNVSSKVIVEAALEGASKNESPFSSRTHPLAGWRRNLPRLTNSIVMKAISRVVTAQLRRTVVYTTPSAIPSTVSDVS